MAAVPTFPQAATAMRVGAGGIPQITYASPAPVVMPPVTTYGGTYAAPTTPKQPRQVVAPTTAMPQVVTTTSGSYAPPVAISRQASKQSMAPSMAPQSRQVSKQVVQHVESRQMSKQSVASFAPQAALAAPTNGAAQAPMLPAMSGSYAPPAAAGSAASSVTTMRTVMVQGGPSFSSGAVPVSGSMTAPMQGAPMVISGSYVPPVSGSYAAPPMQMMATSGSYAPPPMSGSYSAPPMMAVSGSYTAQPMQMGSGSMSIPMYGGAPQMMLPGAGSYGAPPARDIPDPSTVEAQKGAYKRALDKQFQDALSKIEGERETRKQMLRASAQQNKDQFNLQALSGLEAKKLELDTLLNTQLIMLQETAMQHRKVLEEKAAALTLDFQSRKANEDLLMKQYEIQKQFADNERQLCEDFQAKQQLKPAGSPSKADEK